MTLTLPNSIVTLIKQQQEQFVHISTTLPEWIKNTNKGLIIYFYPKDNTAGCSTQAIDFSQYQTAFDELGYTIIGISRDSVGSHEKFISNKNLQIPLISDKDETLCQHFGVIGEKKLYGKIVFGVVRSTFIFDKNAQLIHELRNVRAKAHAEQLLSILQNN